MKENISELSNFSLEELDHHVTYVPTMLPCFFSWENRFWWLEVCSLN